MLKNNRMSATETVKDVVRIATTAGLAKDVIDLLQVKTVLLTDQVSTLEKDNVALAQENTTLLRENRNLKLENEKLKGELQNSRPKSDELYEIATKMLVTLANFDGSITDGELIQRLGLPKAKGDYHFDQLQKRKFVNSSGGQMGRGMFFYVTSAGRDYLAKAGLL